MRLFIVLLSLAFCQASELQVLLKDSSGSPMRAGGILENLQTGARLRFNSDEQGSYQFTGLAAGRYRLLVSREGFAEQSLPLRLTDEEKKQVELRLQPGSRTDRLEIVSTAPLPGVDRALEEIPAPVQSANGRDMEASGALDLSAFLQRRMNGVHLNEIQGNPFQPDLNYRGYTASPLLGTPQGISVFLDGVRQNQPFGDIVSWDLIPRMALAESSLIPGSNPLFGLNTLGGAVSLRSKDGFTHAGTSLAISGGSFGRKIGEFEHGASLANGFNWYLASNFFFEDGWRETSPSAVRQFFGRLGRQGRRTSVSLILGYANNSLLGNGLQEQRFLDRDYRSVYTKPDNTEHRAPNLNLQVRHSLNSRWNLAFQSYYRYVRTRTLNGDINEESLSESVYQPNAAERAALTAAGYRGFPLSGENASNTPFPYWRCLANVLRQDEPEEKCNGLINRTGSLQRNYGFAGQANWASGRQQLTMGAAYDGNRVGFSQTTEFGYLLPDRSVQGLFLQDADNRVELSSRVHTGSVYATDTIRVNPALVLTLSGRYSHTIIDNLDHIRPIAGTGSLTGRHGFQRFNPAAGLTYRLRPSLQTYFSYTEGNRAPTAIELGCADPNAPCKLPNSMAGDPPLHQVVTRSIEAGLRNASEQRLRWSAGFFHADNSNDILFVASEQTGFGYFKNFGKTRRQGAEASFDLRLGRLQWGASYTFLDATFQSEEEVNGTGNSTNEENLDGLPGQEGTIEIRAGNRIPLIPQHLWKTHWELTLHRKAFVDFGLLGVSRSYARGNENNAHQPDGRYYLGSGSSPGYAVANLGGRYRIHARAEIFAQVNNLFNRRYYSAAQLGPTGFTGAGNFIARPFAAIDGEFPVQQATFYAPGAPRGAWAGLRFRF